MSAHRALSFGLTIVLSVGTASAQYSVSAAIALMGDDAGIVSKKPCTVIEKTFDAKPLPNGTTLTRRTQERKWRDSEGRFRKEIAQIGEGQEPVLQIATIIDPVKNTITTLHMDTKSASIVHLQPGQLHPYVDLEDRPLMANPGVQVKVEKMSAKSIAGVPAVGQRVTRTRPPGTIGNDKTIVSVSERWVSPDLKILLATSMDDPREQQTREVTQLDRGEPDATLFLVPADYTVEESQGRPMRQVEIHR